MKEDFIKKLSPYDVAMIGNLYPLTQIDVKHIMCEKGDIESPNSVRHTVIVAIGEEFDNSFKLPKGKSMKAADRRKRTHRKHKQREKMYRDLGYPVERFSEADIGKMREGVGMFPETQHQYALYNRGEKKGEKPITTKQAISMMEHERWLDEQDAIAEYEEAQRIGAMEAIACWEYDAYCCDDMIEHKKAALAELLEKVEKLKEGISLLEMNKALCLKNIAEVQEVLNK